MDRQKIFDQVVAHARKQGHKARDSESGSCLYRAPNGDKCFLGCLFPDELYNPAMENLRISNKEMEAVSKFLEVESQDDEMFLRELQVIHDNRDARDWEEYLRRFAVRFELAYVAPAEVVV